MFHDETYLEWADKRFRESEQWGAMRAGQAKISQLLFSCTRFGADCSFDRAVYEQILAAMVEFGCQLDPNLVKDRIKREERLSMSALGRVSLPGLDRLKMKDIVAVRRNADGFEAWRDSLSQGLTRLEGDVSPDEMASAVDESLARGREQVRREVNATWLDIGQGAAQDFVIGTVAAIPVGGPFSPAVGGVSAVIAAFFEFFKGAKKRKAGKALRAYYSILDPMGET